MVRGPLKEWAEDLIKEEKLISQGYINHESSKYMEMHQAEVMIIHQIWSILMFQSWLEAE